MFKSFYRRRAFAFSGPHGGISSKLVLPEGFDVDKDKCPAVVLMHGFCAKKERPPLPVIAKALAKEGIASLLFDFDAHGASEGNFIDMTISSEIADAKAAADYLNSLAFVDKVAFLGHSQGGVVAGMLAGQLENSPLRPACLVQLAPAAVLKDDAIAGQCMYARYNPADPPEYVSVLFHKLGRKFILEAQKLPIYETSAEYSGKVCIVHGMKDRVVPVTYSEKYKAAYRDCELHLLEREGHMLNSDKKAITDIVVPFLKERLLG